MIYNHIGNACNNVLCSSVTYDVGEGLGSVGVAKRKSVDLHNCMSSEFMYNNVCKEKVCLVGVVKYPKH